MERSNIGVLLIRHQLSAVRARNDYLRAVDVDRCRCHPSNSMRRQSTLRVGLEVTEPMKETLTSLARPVMARGFFSSGITTLRAPWVSPPVWHHHDCSDLSGLCLVISSTLTAQRLRDTEDTSAAGPQWRMPPQVSNPLWRHHDHCMKSSLPSLSLLRSGVHYFVLVFLRCLQQPPRCMPPGSGSPAVHTS